MPERKRRSFATRLLTVVSGEAWTAELQSEPQDYFVVLGQP
ncbi:MAG: hypothetical protein QOE70_4469 [Chthoniobacter sp.]|jgi:hypothetical protein|nr:hypothetical protein [Chthoniobacter sp.]